MKMMIWLIVAILAIGSFACQEENKIRSNKEYKEMDVFSMKKPDKLIDRFSYIVGSTMGSNLKRDSVNDINFDYLIAGIKTALDGKVPLLSKREMDSTMAEMQIILQARQKRKKQTESRIKENNKKEAYEFLAENKKNPGVVVLPDGLQYKIVKKGSGPSPKLNEFVKMNVIGKVLNGEEFDNTYKRKQPIELQLINGILACWYETLPKMKIGSKWIIYSPPELAFKDMDNAMAPPNKLIIFEIELLSISKKPSSKAALPPKQPEHVTDSVVTFDPSNPK